MDKRNKRYDVFLGILAIFLYFFLSLFSGLIISLFGINVENLSETSKYVISLLYEAIILIIIILVHFKTLKLDFKTYKSNIKYYLKTYIKYWLFALIAMYIANTILFIIGGSIAKNEQGVRELIKGNPFIMIILACIVGPILEELIFRISLYKIIGKYKWLFIILSGLIFGSMHVLGEAKTIIDYLYIIPYGIPGSFFAYTLYKSNNSCVPISLHIIHNTFALLVQFIAM